MGRTWGTVLGVGRSSGMGGRDLADCLEEGEEVVVGWGREGEERVSLRFRLAFLFLFELKRM